MPRDVTTQWNSSFDMLDFALDYRPAIDQIIDEKEMKLRHYELSEEEWMIVKQLRDVLKVCSSLLIHYPCSLFQYCRSSKMQCSSFHGHTQILLVLSLPWIAFQLSSVAMPVMTNNHSQSALASKRGWSYSTNTTNLS
jgi:hypothetical protein